MHCGQLIAWSPIMTSLREKNKVPVIKCAFQLKKKKKSNATIILLLFVVFNLLILIHFGLSSINTSQMSSHMVAYSFRWFTIKLLFRNKGFWKVLCFYHWSNLTESGVDLKVRLYTKIVLQ